MPDTIPAKSGAPEAWAIPRQRGRAIRKTIRPAMESYLIFGDITN
jgi:hypothetical protein